MASYNSTFLVKDALVEYSVSVEILRREMDQALQNFLERNRKRKTNM